MCHCLSISYKSSVVTSGTVKKVIKLAANEAYPLYKNKSFSSRKLKNIDAMSAPNFPDDAEIPWHMAARVQKKGIPVRKFVKWTRHLEANNHIGESK